MKRVLCIGDACADILIPYGKARQGHSAFPDFSPGGTVANTASGLGRLGVPCAFLGKAGTDYFGKSMRQALAGDGVDVSHFTLSDSLVSTMVLVVVDEQGERFPFLMPRDNPAHLAITQGDLPHTLLDEFDMVHTSGLMLFEQGPASALCDFLELCACRGKFITLDINLRVETKAQNMAFLRRAADCAHLLLGAAEEEIMPFAGKDTVDAAARSLVTPSRAVVARMGSKGARVYTALGEHACPGFPVPVADTLGAGDCYNSGLLYALAKGHSLHTANQWGCAAAALSLLRPGARNGPTAEHLHQFLAQQGIV